jgi:threonine synthase
MLTCASCGNEYPLGSQRWRCGCGGILDISSSPNLTGNWIDSRRFDIWRYRRAIILEKRAETGPEQLLTLGEGWTPLLPYAPPLRKQNSSVKFFLKHDHLMPTGSFKDRGSAVLVQHVRNLGITEVVEDSSGNAGASIAAYTGAAHIKSSIFVPAATSPEKTAQIEAYGADLVRVPGSREDTAAAALNAAKGSYYSSHSWNPFFFQGTKTAAYEIAEQLAWDPPDTVIAPCGNGTLVLGLAMGFQELYANRIISRLPKIMAVQSERCAPVFAEAREAGNSSAESGQQARAWEKTVASGIAIARPVRQGQIVAAVAKTKGRIVTVSDDEIVRACKTAWQYGLYIEETSAVSLAALQNYVDNISNNNEIVVALLTGHGLKRTIEMKSEGQQ